MAIYHLSASIVKRSAGRSVTAAAAYRAAAKIEDLKTGIIHDYGRKQGVDYSEIISPVFPNSNSSNQWLTNRAELWNKIELIEKRKDAQLAREVTIAIPKELSKPDQIALVREYVNTNYVAAGMIADLNLHHLDGDNPHAHILLTMRNLETSPEGVVEFGLKNTDWNSKELLLAQRKSWEEITNQYLAARGLETRIDCRSLEEQGSPYIPQIHVGVHAMAMKRKGIKTDRGDEFERIEAANHDIRARLEETYQQEYTEPEREQDSNIQIQLENLDREKYRKPESEVKPELTEQQQQIAADSKLAELIIQVMPPKSRETQTFGVYKIKPYNDGFDVRTNNSIIILKLKLENDTWVKSIRYPIKGERRKHNYSNSDIDAKVEDFIKTIEKHKIEIDELKTKSEAEEERKKAEKEKAKAEAEIKKVNNEKARAEAQIRKINNELLKPQRAEERRVKMEAQKAETRQRNLKKAEDRIASKIIANAEREVRLAAQKIEYEKRKIERDKIKEKEANLAYERRKIERERVVNEINKAAENISHLLGNAVSAEFNVEGNTLEISRNSENCMTVYINKYWYNLRLYSDGNWEVEDDYYSRNSFNDRYKTIEKCLEVGTLIYKREKESEAARQDAMKQQAVQSAANKARKAEEQQIVLATEPTRETKVVEPVTQKVKLEEAQTEPKKGRQEQPKLDPDDLTELIRNFAIWAHDTDDLKVSHNRPTRIVESSKRPVRITANLQDDESINFKIKDYEENISFEVITKNRRVSWDMDGELTPLIIDQLRAISGVLEQQKVIEREPQALIEDPADSSEVAVQLKQQQLDRETIEKSQLKRKPNRGFER